MGVAFFCLHLLTSMGLVVIFGGIFSLQGTCFEWVVIGVVVVFRVVVMTLLVMVKKKTSGGIKELEEPHDVIFYFYFYFFKSYV